MIGLIGKKLGMSRLFTEEGASIPVTLIEVKPNRVTQIKNKLKEGYDAVQVTTGEQKINRVNKPLAGHYAKAGVDLGRGLWEFRGAPQEIAKIEKEGCIDLSWFQQVDLVDVTGTSKGKGFAGVIKRWNFSSQPASHGNSLSHRAPGSIGQNQTPGRVFKGKKMAGRLGGDRVTMQNLKVIRIDLERNVLWLKGAVPGATGGDVMIRPSIKGASLSHSSEVGA